MTISNNPGFRTAQAFLAILFLGLFAIAARNVIDPDVWWHLKTGQYIFEHKSVPHADPFSYTRAGEPWVAHEWLTELLLFGVQRALGFGGLIVCFAAVISAAFFMLYLRCGPDPYIAGVAVLYGALTTLPVWGVRPQVLSLLLASLWLLILERSERNAKLLWWTLPLTLLWVNLHAGFALGLALSALFLIGEWFESGFGRTAVGASHLMTHRKTAAIILFLDLLLVPCNPNGLRMFSYPFETLHSAAMQNYILEWASPNFHHAEYWPFLVLVLAVFGAMAGLGLHIRPRDLLVLIVSLYAGLGSIRMIPLFVLIAVPILARGLASRAAIRRQRPPPNVSHSLVNAVIVLAMAVFCGVHMLQVIQRQPAAEAEHFPLGAAAYLQSHPSGQIFNHYDWGGYLIWRLASPVFIDGRADLYGEQLLDQFASTYQLKAGWRQTLLDWNVDTVVIPADSALATALRASPDWRVSYRDQQAVVLSAPNRTGRMDSPSPTPGMQENYARRLFAGYYEGYQIPRAVRFDGMRVPQRP